MENVYRPGTIKQLDTLIHNSRTKLTYVAGATDLMVQSGHWNTASTLVDLGCMAEIMNTIQITESQAIIGAALPLTDIIANSVIQQQFPILIAACRQIGSVQIQNRATLGGNIANASPAGDSLPVLAVLDADIWIGPRRDEQFRKMKIDEVMLNPGETSLKDNRYIAAIAIPFTEPEHRFWYFRKVGQRRALAISKVSLAAIGWIKDSCIEQIRISTGSVSPQITRALKTEQLLTGQKLTEAIIERARESIMHEIAPIADIRSTRKYRKYICGELLREALYGLLQ